jgi:hypothetical protein
MCCNFLSKPVSKFSHYKKYSASWYHKFKAVCCKAMAIVIRLQWNTNFIVRFSINPQTLRDRLFIAEGQTERGMGMFNLKVALLAILERHYKRDTDIQMGWEISRIHTARISDITLISVRSKQLYTPYTHNIWYRLTLCPFTIAVHTIYPQYLISPY